MNETIKIVEPKENWKRTAFIKSLNRTRTEFDKNEIKAKLKEIRIKSIDNYEKFGIEFKKNLIKKGIKVVNAKNSIEATKYIAKIVDNKKLYINKSIVIDELRDGIEKKGFQIIETYKEELGINNEAEIKNYWELAEIPHDILWNSFTSRQPLMSLRNTDRHENRLNSLFSMENKVDNLKNDYDGTGLLGANVVSANDGNIFFLQHSENISKILETLDKIIIVVGIDKIVENSSDAYFQTKCTSLFGLDNILYDLFHFPPKIETNTGEESTTKNHNKKIENRQDSLFSYKNKSKDIHVIILDNGRTKIINSDFKELSYCISCKACRAACPLQNSLREKNRNELSGKEIIFSSLTKNLEYISKNGLYECTLCENCKNVCPLEIPTPSFIVKSRYNAIDFMPEVHQNICQNIKEFNNPFKEEKEQRNMFYRKEYTIKKNSILLYFGCVASYQRGKIISSTTRILDSLGIDYFVLGEEESCCGYPAYISGSNDFQSIVESNVKKINELEPKLMLTTCAGCIKTFRNLYQKYAKLNTKPIHIVEYLAPLIMDGKLKFNKEFKKRVAYHDPCDLGRALNIYEEPRVILKNIPGLNFIEFPKNRENARCCGSGGGLKAFDDELSKSIGTERLTEALENNVEVVVSACPACAMNLQHSSRKLKEERNAKIKIMDITEVVGRAI